MGTLRIAMIGLGNMGSYHAGILPKLPDVEIAGVCDINEIKAKSIGEKLGVKWCTDYHDLLDHAEAVWICTEPFNRREIVLTCARNGKHIFTEKPIANDLGDAHAMVEAADQAGVVYMLGYCLRFWNPYKLLKTSFSSGELGELVECWTRRYMPTDMSSTWYGWQEKSGGAMLDFGSHDIDWLRWIGGDVETVFGYERQVRSTMHAYEHGHILMRFIQGGVGSASDSWASCLDDSSVGIVGTKGAMIVERCGDIRKKIGSGEEIKLGNDAVMDVNPQGEVGKKDDRGIIQRIDSPGESIQEHFIRCVQQGCSPTPSASDGLKTLATITALHDSVRKGISVRVGDYL